MLIEFGNRLARGCRSFTCLLFLVCLPAFAASPTTTNLAIMSGGSAVTTVPSGGMVTLIATVTNGTGPVTPGRVNFCDATAAYCAGIHLLGTAQLTSAGTASMTFFPGLGSHSYIAVFVGTNNNSASSSSKGSLAVTGKFPTTTTIAQSGSVNNYTLTATTIGIGSLTTSPTGTVSFADTTNANQILATAVAGAGTAALNFAASASSPTSIVANVAVAADFNGDGKVDLAISDLHTLAILLGNGDGTFRAVTASPASSSSPMATGDFNGDGKMDLVVADPASNSSGILLGNGDGTFTTGASLATGNPVAVVVDDFNGDGNADLAVVTTSLGNDIITILLGNGDGTFMALPTTYVAGRGATIRTGDFDNNGRRDLISVASGNTGADVFLGNGDGTFTRGPLQNGLQHVGDDNALLVGDLNGDGIDDIVVGNQFNKLEIYLGKGDATFTAAPVVTLPSPMPNPPIGDPIFNPVIADINADGKADIVLNSASAVYVFLGNGDGTFAPQVAQASGRYVTVADLNDDGILDMVFTTSGSSNVVAGLLTQLTETVTATATNIAVPGKGTHAVLASYPGDSNYVSSVSATTSLTAVTATTLTLNVNPASSVFLGQQTTLTATLNPSSAQGQSSDGESITFNNNGVSVGTAKLAGGVATLTANLSPIGQASLNAAYSGDIALGSSISNAVAYTVYPAPSVTVSFASSQVTVGQAASTTDAFTLTPSTGYSGTVQFQCSNLPANAQCSVAPSSVSFTGSGSPASATLTIQTGVSTQSASLMPLPGPVEHGRNTLAAIVWMPGFLLAMVPFRRSKTRLRLRTAILPSLSLFAFCAMLMACSGGPSSGNTKTPTGTYTIQLVVSGPNGLSQNTPLNITVQ
jgi:hypothetical protein